MKGKLILLTGAIYLTLFGFLPKVSAQEDGTVQINPNDIGFEIPNFEEFMSFLIKFFFVIAGLMALFYMLWGALSWVTSGGDKDAVGKARDKIINAVIGVLMIIATLAIIVALEQVVFKGRICFGLTCELQLPTLLKCPGKRDPNPDGSCPTTDAGSSQASKSETSGSDVLASGSQNESGETSGNGDSTESVFGARTESASANVESELPETGL